MELNLMEKEGKFSLDTAALEKAIKEGTVDAIKSEIKSALEVERKEIFTRQTDALWEREGKTVVDTSFFRKRYQAEDGRMLDGKELGLKMATSGGPFLKLSPAMEQFAQCCRLGFDPNKMAARGIAVQDYNKEIAEWNKKDTATGLTTTDVGALVPIEFLATVIEFATAQSALIPKLWRIPMGSLTMRIPTLAQSAGSYFGGLVLYHPDEAELKTETKPSFSYKTFTAKKLIGIIPLTDEVIMDSSINIINYITGLFVRGFQYKIEGEVISGTGLLGQMLGIINDPSINLVGRTTLGTVKYDDLVNLESALDENFQDLTWLSRRLTLNTLRKQKDTVGQPLFHDGFNPYLGTPYPPSIFGYPVVKTRNCPALGLKGDIVLGDMGYYIWAVRQDMTIDMSRDVRFFYDETVLRFVMRMDGMPGVSIAFAILNSAPES